MRGVSTGDPANDRRLAERMAFAALRRAYDRLADTPLSLRWAVRLARRGVRRRLAAWRQAYRDLCAGNA